VVTRQQASCFFKGKRDGEGPRQPISGAGGEYGQGNIAAHQSADDPGNRAIPTCCNHQVWFTFASLPNDFSEVFIAGSFVELSCPAVCLKLTIENLADFCRVGAARDGVQDNKNTATGISCVIGHKMRSIERNKICNLRI
jgi:hypothetical protein